jgi:hypothetical protein
MLIEVLSKSREALPPPSPYRDEEAPHSVEPLDDQLVKAVASGRTLPRFVSIDGSSRSLFTPTFSIHIASVAVYGASPGAPSTCPGDLGLAAPYLAVRAPRGVLKEVEARFPFVKVSHNNRYFDEGYRDEDDIAELLRTSLENEALGLALGQGGESVVVVDGPLYLSHMAIADVAAKRLEILGKGARAVGVVKRVENSAKLCRGEVLEALGLAVDRGRCNDAYVAQRLGRGLGFTLIGPFKLRWEHKGLMQYMFRDVVFWYVNAMGFVYRVEALAESADEGIVEALAKSTTERGVPYPIDVVDRYAKRVTASLLVFLGERARARGVSPTYDSEQAIVQALQELAGYVGGGSAR